MDNNTVKPYARFDLNLAYDLKLANIKQFRVFGSVSNLMDKSPPFTGGGISGATAGYHDTLGRAYRLRCRGDRRVIAPKAALMTETMIGGFMKTEIDRPGAWAVALCAVVLAGCDAAKDVRTGAIHHCRGQGGSQGRDQRTWVEDAPSRCATAPTAASDSFVGALMLRVPTDDTGAGSFTFGSLDAGTAYNVEVTGQPFGKHCVPVSGSPGTLTEGRGNQRRDQLHADIPRYDLTVPIPPTPAVFSGLTGAKVVLYTGRADAGAYRFARADQRHLQ